MTVNNNNPIVTPTASLEDDNDDSNATNSAVAAAAAAAAASAPTSRGRGGEQEHGTDECCWLSKLLNGQNLSALDIQRLKDNRQSIPLLDRNLAERSAQAAGDGHHQQQQQPVFHQQLVRIRGGFVQDMFPSEYFETSSSTGNSSSNNCRRGSCPTLAERTPLLIAPIPFSTPWFRNVLSEKQVEHRNKRARNCTSGSDVSSGGGSSGVGGVTKKSNNMLMNYDKQQQQHASNGVDEEYESSSSYWWDAETMKSDPDQVPVLAQFYYDQYDWAGAAQYNHHQQQQQPQSPSSDQHDKNNNSNDHYKVRLNDIVEVIGILESHSHHDGDDGDEDMAVVDCNDTTTGVVMDMDAGAFWDEDDTAATTPPSHIPRLHVLWFGFLDFDTIAAQSLCQNTIVLSKHHERSKQNTNEDDINNDTASQLLALALEIDQLSATALYLNLLSMAERQPKNHGNHGGGPHGIVTKTPSGATLGCSSLHLILPNHESCCRFQQRLESVLSQIVPTIHSIDILGDNKNGNNMSSLSKTSHRLLQLPAKNQGRIQPTLWQLPQGSVLILNTSSGGGSSRSSDENTMPDPSMSQALEMLTMHHHLPYQFDGGVKIPFEADVRVIVLSSAAAATADDSNHHCPEFLPCTAQAKCCFPSSSSNHEYDDNVDEKNSTSHRHDRLSEEQATFLRQCLARARAGSSNNSNIGLPSVVLKRAQNDFIQRRTMFREREQQRQGSSGIMVTTTQNSATRSCGNRHLPDDMDLHRWLTWTRLLARQGRGNAFAVGAELDHVVATIQDWEKALALDDALMYSNLS